MPRQKIKLEFNPDRMTGSELKKAVEALTAILLARLDNPDDGEPALNQIDNALNTFTF